ncbi:oxidoreductase [Crucibulum laeve]|uniref:Oxidoreductase n=1 Tax=Crucibulum laeve TaxID=68775 RepID=A0A5C3LYH4_9AGAR|nr:oxidoreductase [Crucibulum laeve]
MPRVVLVTGCTTGGIGFVLCEEFALQGCKVYASSRNVATIADFKHPNIDKIAIDVTNDDSVQNGIEHIVQAEGHLDVVVNNAGVITAGPLIDQPLDAVKHVFDTNTFAILRVARAVIPVMAARRNGVIVNIGSIVGEVATPWNGVYCASKAAVLSLSEVLWIECKPFNISVVHVAPGAIKSNFSANGANHFTLPPNTLYSNFLPNILQRIHASQGSNRMPTEAFAKEVVSKTLRPNPPRYMTIGGHSRLFSLFKWLPRSWVLLRLWQFYSKKL